MTAREDCDMVLLVQAEFDGELDAAQAATLAAHRVECPVCQAAGEELARSRALIGDTLYQPLPDAARQRILQQIAAVRPTPPQRPRLRLRDLRVPAFGFGLGALAAAALSLLLLLPGERNLTAEIVAGHIRALQPGHLEDVVSTDRHTVKPWFDGRLDFAPPVEDLVAAGFPLKGGRLDYIGGRPVAALVYQRDRHIIDLYIWPQRSGAAAIRAGERQGYNVVHWNRGGMAFWAVSDVEANQLHRFAELWQQPP
jgi:anti-sigma factor RsiW